MKSSFKFFLVFQFGLKFWSHPYKTKKLTSSEVKYILLKLLEIVFEDTLICILSTNLSNHLSIYLSIDLIACLQQSMLTRRLLALHWPGWRFPPQGRGEASRCPVLRACSSSTDKANELVSTRLGKGKEDSNTWTCFSCDKKDGQKKWEIDAGDRISNKELLRARS